MKYDRDRGECIRRNCGEQLGAYREQNWQLIRFSNSSAAGHRGGSFISYGKNTARFCFGGRRPLFLFAVDWSTWICPHFWTDPTALQQKMIQWRGLRKTFLTASEMYDSERLWTYGFIRALLEHCSSKSNRTERKRMTLFTRLSPCQPMALVNEEKEIAWIRMKE